MSLHFSHSELQQRRQRVIEELDKRGFYGLLCFRQESDYYLTGFDTFGYCFYQCLYIGVDGSLTLLTRAPDLRQAQHTSDIDDIRIWTDADGSTPLQHTKEILLEHGCRGKTLGVEFDAYGLNAANGRKLEAMLEGFCRYEDASDLVSTLRLVKSETELHYVEQAAKLADEALDAALPLIRPGAWEGDILAAMQSAIFRGDGDYPANEFIIGSGRDALLCRYHAGRRHLQDRDQITLEWAGAYRHYHAAMMRTFVLGLPDQEHHYLFSVAEEAMQACEEALQVGRPIGRVFDAHALIADNAGLKDHRLNACGYSLGATFAPTWMDWPMLYTANPVAAEENMVFFLHMIFENSDSGKAMTQGHTVRVTKQGVKRLSRHGLAFIA